MEQEQRSLLKLREQLACWGRKCGCQEQEAALLDCEGVCLTVVAQPAREHCDLGEQHGQYQQNLYQEDLELEDLAA